MTNIELLLCIVVVLLIFLNPLQLNINENFNKRFTIVGDWLTAQDKQFNHIAKWTDAVTKHLTEYPNGSNTKDTKAAQTEARTS